MRSLVLGYDSALEIWSNQHAQRPATHLSKRGIESALRNAKHTITQEIIDNVRQLPWTHHISPQLNLIVPNAEDCRKLNNIKCHKQAAPLPRGSLIPIGEPFSAGKGGKIQVFVTSPELTFVHMSRYLPLFELIELGYELCGDYAIAPKSPYGFIERKSVTTAGDLKRFLNISSNIHGIKQARKAITWVRDGSRSPKETNICQLACMPYRYGGFNMRAPKLNKEIAVPAKLEHIVGSSKCVPDIYWKEIRTIIEYDSKTHHSAIDQMEHDSRKRTLYQLLELECITVTSGQLYDFDNIASVFDDLNMRIHHAVNARRPECPTNEIRKRQKTLHCFLLYGSRRERFTDPVLIEKK